MTKDLKRAVGTAKKAAKAKTRKMTEFKAETGTKKKKDDSLVKAATAAQKKAKAKTRKMAEFRAETGTKKKKDDSLVKAATAAQKKANAKTRKMAEFRHEETEVADDTLARGVARAKRDLKAEKAVQTAFRRK
jgi:hypothetical protein